MKTIQSRVYTNVILTLIAVLLGVLATQQFVAFSTDAQAQRDRDSSNRYGGPLDSPSGDKLVADAIRELAAATKEIAEAETKNSEALKDVGTSLKKLGAN